MPDDLKSLFQVCEVEITYKNKTPYHERLIVDTPWYAYDIFKSTWDTDKVELHEQFKIMLLDNKLTCLGLSEISTGGLDNCFVDPRIVFATALKSKATRLIFAHNHPSGVLKPSEPDIMMTKRLVEAGRLLDISVMDHLIVAPHGYYSFADNGMMPNWNPKQTLHPSSPVS
jgi:DNA repair protein RadC